MNILLISPGNCDLLHNVSIPLGLVSIGTCLKRAGHNVKIIDLCISHVSIKKVIADFKPDISGISVRSPKQISFALDISRKLHCSGIPVVWGGPFTNQAPLQQFFDSGVVDILSLSEGEMTWIELADSFAANRPLEEIDGIAFKKNEKIIRTKDREFMDLSKLPPSDWSLIDVSKYYQHLYGAKRLVYVYMSKGCPGHCAFCYNADFHRSCLRRKSLDTFMTELKELINDYEIDGFYLADECAFSKKSELYELCDALDELNRKLIWGFETRVGVLSEEDMQRAYDSGCRCIHFGIESASPEMMKRIGKNIPMDKVIPAFEACNKIGIIPVSTFIIGMPGETVDDLKHTVNFAKKLPSNELSVMLYAYLYNSDFGREIYNSKKYKLPRKLSDYKKVDLFHNRLPNFSQIPTKDLKVVQGYFAWKLLFKKDYSEYPEDEKGFVVLYKHIETLFKRLSYINIIHLPEAFIKSGFPFIRFFISATFCKKTRKKYDLD